MNRNTFIAETALDPDLGNPFWGGKGLGFSVVYIIWYTRSIAGCRARFAFPADKVHPGARCPGLFGVLVII